MQVVVVSATMPNDILEMTKKFMTDPIRVLVKRDELTLEVRTFSHPSLACLHLCPYATCKRNQWCLALLMLSARTDISAPSSKPSPTSIVSACPSKVDARSLPVHCACVQLVWVQQVSVSAWHVL